MSLIIPSSYGTATQIEGLVRTVFELGQRVYLGYVPGTLPTTPDGFVYPYAVIWPGAGVPVDDAAVCGPPDPSGQRFDFTTTLVAADVASVLQAADRVKAVLYGQPVGNGVVQPNMLQQEGATVLEEVNERPMRYSLPLSWYVQTQ